MTLNFFHHRYHAYYHGQYRHAKKLFAIDLFLLFSALLIGGAILFLYFWEPTSKQWIDLEISFGANRIKSGEPITVNITYTNHSRQKVTDAILAIQMPPDFAIEREANLKSEFSKHWLVRIPEILPRSRGQKQLHGILWAKPKTSATVSALMSYQPENSKERGQASNSFILIPAESVLQTRLSLAATTALPQSQIAYSYALKNTGANPMIVKLSTDWGPDAELSSDPLVELSPGAKKIYQGQLRTPSIPQAARFLVKAGIIIDGRIVPQSVDSAAIKIIWPAKSVNLITEKQPTNLTATQSTPSLLAQTRYYTDEGDRLGHGPVPPQNNTTTRYWVFIEVKNLTLPARAAAFSAVLAPGVEFTGKQSVTLGAPIVYGAADGILRWQHANLPTDGRLGLYFEVAVNPTPEQVGKDIAILKNIKFSATDNATGKLFDLSAPNLTNQLPASDQGARI